MISGLLATVMILAPAEFSVRVEGEGYLRFLREGRAVFARSATLVVAGGELREKSGPGFLPPIRVASSVTVGSDGTVMLAQTKVGRLYLARFDASASFEPSGAFQIARDRAELGYPQSEGFGKIVCDSGVLVTPNAQPPTPNTQHLPPKPPTANRQPPTPSPLSATVPDKVEVDGPRFTLGDIAKLQGPAADVARLAEIDLGNAPVHGVPMNFSRERILAKLIYLKYDKNAITLDMPPAVQIVRKGQRVTVDQLVDAAKKAVAEKHGVTGEMTADERISEVMAPVGKLEIVTESANWAGGSASVTLGIKVDGKRFIGRTIRLTGDCLMPAVAMGASVTVRFVTNGLSVELPGRAKSAGAIGQTIEVSVAALDSRETTTHQATVKSAGVVEVKL